MLEADAALLVRLTALVHRAVGMTRSVHDNYEVGLVDDPAVGTRFDTLSRELGDAFVAVELPGRKHSTLTAHRQQVAVDRVLAFFRDTLL